VSYSKGVGTTHFLGSNGEVIAQGTTSGDALEVAVTRNQSGAIVIQAKGDEANGVAYLNPSITYDLFITVTSQGPTGNATVQVTGWHEGFPAYEVTAARLISGTPPVVVYSSDPRNIGKGPYSLFPPMDVQANATATLGPPTSSTTGCSTAAATTTATPQKR